MLHRFPALAVALFLVAGCAATSPEKAPPVADAAPSSSMSAPAPTLPATPADDNLNAVVWTQKSIEHDLIFTQTYRDAQSRLLAALEDKRWDALPPNDRVRPAQGLKPAVVMDVDETVLDNSPYQARVIKSGGEFNEADWAAWCKEARARALPGVVDFAKFATAHGITVLYVTNRAKDLDAATLDNLRKVGMPVADPSVFYGLGTFVEGCEQIGSEKGCRRQLISRTYRVLMQFGDQLGDFVTVLANTTAGQEKAMSSHLAWIGTRWFVLPNPTYGAWEPALFNNDWTAPREQRRAAKEKALRLQ